MSALGRRQVSLRVARPRLVAGAVGLAAIAAVLAPRLRSGGSPLDEGGVLAYADRILHGQLPMRQLHSFYGPLSTWLVAGVFKVFGPSLYAERAVGLVYRLVLAAALLGLVRRHGAGVIAVATVLLLWLLPLQGLAAYSTYGAMACTATAILLADLDRPFAAGVAGGVALLLRFDWLLAACLALLPYFVAADRRGRRRLVAGGVAGTIAYLPYLGFVMGPSRLHVFLLGIRRGQAGRHLHVSLAPHGVGLLLELMLLAVAFLLALGLRRRHTAEGLVFLSVGLAALGVLPYALNRADLQHVLVGATPPLVLLAAAVPAALGARRARVAGVLVVAAAVVSVGVRDASRLLGVDVFSASLDSARTAATVSHAGRSFRLAHRPVADAAQRAVLRAAAIGPRGGGLFVGPGDLRVTSYSDSFFYFLLPQFRAATFYITLDPGSTDLPGHHLARELAHADVLILDDAYDPERGERVHYGTDAPNRVVARDFCLRGRYPPFRVYARCRASAANTGTAIRGVRRGRPIA